VHLVRKISWSQELQVPSLERLLGVSGAQQARQVRVGKLWYDPSNVNHVLQRYCKQIFIHTGNDKFPYQFIGSGTAVKIGNRHLLFCTGHQISQFNPDRVAIYVKANNSTITASSLLVPEITNYNSDTDWIDIRALVYNVQNYAIANLSGEFFPVESECVWPAEDTGHFVVFGYPAERQDVDYESPHVTAHVVEVSADYDGASNSPYVHRLKMSRNEVFDSDGMSGGSVFYIGRKAGSFFAGLAGLIIRGSKTSDYIHFIEADFLQRMAIK
jgi:hypothetical protein